MSWQRRHGPCIAGYKKIQNYSGRYQSRGTSATVFDHILLTGTQIHHSWLDGDSVARAAPCSADQNQHWCIILFPFRTLTLACAINPKICLLKNILVTLETNRNLVQFLNCLKDKERFSWFRMATLWTGKNSSTSRSKLKRAVSALYVDRDYSKKGYGAEKHRCHFSMYLEFEIYFFIRKL